MPSDDSRALHVGGHEDAGPRVAQLNFLIKIGVLTPAQSERLIRTQPRVLSRYGIEVLWEREGLVAVHKPFDMRIDLRTGETRRWPQEQTVADWFVAAYPSAPCVYFCNQLDHATSGVLLLGTCKRSARIGCSLFSQRRVKKLYTTLVRGRASWTLGEEVCLNFDLAIDPVEAFQRRVAASGEQGAQPARTVVKVVGRGWWPRAEAAQALGFEGRRVEVSLIEAELVTGRRHQIRLHLAAAGVPILGDDTYGGNPFGDRSLTYRMFLHARRLEFKLPSGEPVSIEAPCEFLEDFNLDSSL